MDTNAIQQQQNKNDTPTSPSPEMFSFPSTPTEPENDNDFEFGSCINPDSPTQTDLTRTSITSPADQFFLNGRLLPHDFHTTTTTTTRNSFSAMTTTTISATLSRGTSIGSSASSCMTYSNKGSLTSSRSNSTSSSRTVGNVSTCSSARNSSSDVSERKAAFRIPKHRSVSGFGGAGGTVSSSSQRWQFIAQAPVLGHSRSLRSRKEARVGPSASPRNQKRGNNDNGSDGILHRMLRSFIATCKACHALEGKDNDFDLDNGSVLGN